MILMSLAACVGAAVLLCFVAGTSKVILAPDLDHYEYDA